MANNVGLALAAEKLMGIEITERCRVLRVIACEMSRIISHLVWLGTTGIDLGAFTPFLWSFQERERIYNLQESWTGARLTTSLTRVGGHDGRHSRRVRGGAARLLPHLPEDAATRWTRCSPGTRSGSGGPRASARSPPTRRSTTRSPGPMLRASGVDYDVRKDRPYLGYETYDFDVPVGEHGDIYDRYRVRLEEMYQSTRILEQALDRLASSRARRSTWTIPRVILPPKSRAMSDMEAMIFHFKQVMEGVQAAGGRGLLGIENPKGELGYYFVSDGTAKPVRWRIRPPSFINLACLPKMCEGALLSDVIAINASVDIVMGEVDR